MTSPQIARLSWGYHRVLPLVGSCAGVLLAFGGVSGCIEVTAVPTLQAAPQARSTMGDRDDLWAAVTVAAERSELAIVDVFYEPDQRTYLLRTIRDEPGELVLVGPGAGEGDTVYGPMFDGPGGPTGPIEMTCVIGRFGHPERERRFMRDIARRLEQLHGVGVSPLRW